MDEPSIKSCMPKTDQMALEEFDLEIKDKKGSDNVIADHLSRIENLTEEEGEIEIKEKFTNEQLFQVTIQVL